MKPTANRKNFPASMSVPSSRVNGAPPRSSSTPRSRTSSSGRTAHSSQSLSFGPISRTMRARLAGDGCSAAGRASRTLRPPRSPSPILDRRLARHRPTRFGVCCPSLPKRSAVLHLMRVAISTAPVSRLKTTFVCRIDYLRGPLCAKTHARYGSATPNCRSSTFSVTAGGTQRYAPQAPEIYSDDDLVLEAVLAGHGIAQLAGYQACAHLANGALVACLQQNAPDDRGHYLCYLGRTHMPPRMRVFIDFAIDRIRGMDLDCMTPVVQASAYELDVRATEPVPH